MANELRQLVDTANAPIFGIDVNGNVNEWNNKTAEITGFSKKEAFDKPLVSTFIVPSLRNSVQEVLDKALHGNETSNYELEFETKSKEIRYLLVNATTRRDAENNIVGVVGVAQDGKLLHTFHWMLCLLQLVVRLFPFSILFLSISQSPSRQRTIVLCQPWLESFVSSLIQRMLQSLALTST
jgi:PAS domain S-box-containing protein